MHGVVERCTKEFGRRTSFRDHFGVLGVKGRIILKWLLRKWDVKKMELDTVG
jgi:hypothetical protein